MSIYQRGISLMYDNKICTKFEYTKTDTFVPFLFEIKLPCQ